MEVGEYIAKLLISFIILAGILTLLLWLLRKRGLIPEIQSSDKLKIISALRLTPKVHLFVIKAGEKEIVVGVSDKSINLLCEIKGDKD